MVVYYIKKDSKIEKTEKSIKVDGVVLKKRDVLDFTCEKCGIHVKQGFYFSKKFLNLNFICRNCYTKQTNLKKYGVEWSLQSEVIKEKSRNTSLRKYGKEHHLQNEDILKKQKQTNLKKYGVENVSQNKNIRSKVENTKINKYGNKNFVNFKKARQTNLEKYGVECILQAGEIRNRIDKNNLEKYGCHPSNNEIIRLKIVENTKKTIYNRMLNSDRLKDRVEPLFDINHYDGILKRYLWKCKKCNTKFEDHLDDGRIPRCPICYPKLSGYSNQEKEIVDWLRSLNYELEENNRTILSGKELDIYLSDYNLAIEYNGLYWHSILFVDDKNHHQNKVELCHNQGIRLLHIWEDEWMDNPKEVKEKILYYINKLSEEIKSTKPKLVEKNGYRIWI